MAILTDVSHTGGADGSSHMSRESVESLQTHAIPVQAQSFAVGDHASHYHAVDALSSNVLPAQRDRVSATDAQHKAPSTKRRKINTCFPCKQRKVKCDRQHPYCGQCQKHRIPAERCVWSSDMGVSDMHSSLEFAKPDTHAPIGLAGEWPAQGAELGLDNDARAVIERISHLEQRLSGASPSQPAHEIAGPSTGQAQIDPLLLAGTTLSLGDVNDRQGAALPQDTAVAAELAFWRSKMEQHQRPTHGESTQMAQMQAEQNIAADALAMFARHNQHAQLSSEQALGRVGTTSDSRAGLLGTVFDSAFTIPGSSPASVRIRSALELLPTSQQVDYLLKTLQTVDLHLFCGVSWRLVRMQLATLRQQLGGWNRMHANVPEHIDVSFLALLLALLGIAAHYVESRFFIEQGLCASTDQIGSRAYLLTSG